MTRCVSLRGDRLILRREHGIFRGEGGILGGELTLVDRPDLVEHGPQVAHILRASAGDGLLNLGRRHAIGALDGVRPLSGGRPLVRTGAGLVPDQLLEGRVQRPARRGSGGRPPGSRA